MLELLNSAWNGWRNFIFYGKYPALLLLVLVVFWFFSDRKREPVLMRYATVMTICCIFPPTAVLLMKYQTKFYDYQWIWSCVPLTIVVAYAGTVLLGHFKMLPAGDLEKKGQKRLFARKGETAAAACVIVILILLCGRLTDPLAEVKTHWQQSIASEATVTAIKEMVIEDKKTAAVADDETMAEEPMLWAPKEIMAAARIYCPEMQLLYGRDLWDASLGAYTYDTYTEAEEDLCQWMHCTGVFGTVDGYRLDGTVLEGKRCVGQALELGVDCIVVPSVMTQEAIAELTTILEEALVSFDIQMQQTETYYVFTWN